MFCFHVSCFCLSLLMLALFLVCFILFLSCFRFVSCFAFTDYEKHCFPCNSSVFSHIGYKVVYIFSVSCLVLVSFSCVVCFHFRHFICIILCLCCRVFSFFLTGLSGFVVCIFLSSSLFCCFVLNFVFFCFPHSSQKRPPKNLTQQKKTKNKNAEKTDKKNQLAQLCSQIVFPSFGGGLKNADFCWKQYKIVVSAY